MCGIAGIVAIDSDRQIEPRCRAMEQVLIHRGPDDGGLFVDDERRVALASRRLAIIDLSPAGHMPMFSPDGRFAIVFNGEIYNYRELRAEMLKRGAQLRSESDTEVVLRLYGEQGPACLQALNGMFALAIWDAHERTLFLARDRIGKKPLLYAHQPDGTLLFASEHQALLRHPALDRRPSLAAIDYYLRYGYVPAPLSGFEAVRKLPPGHHLLWHAGKVQVRKYWEPPPSEPRQIGEQQAVEEFTALFGDAVGRRLISDVPLGAFLSGGIDSASVVAEMAARSARPVKTFSIGFGDDRYNELPGARLVAQRFGTDHHEFVVEPCAGDLLPRLVRHYGEPYADSSALPTYALSRLTREHVTVALTGDGGDEVLAGYERYRAALTAARIEAALPLPKAVYRLTGRLLPAGQDLRTTLTRARRFATGLADSTGGRYNRWMSLFETDLLSASVTPEFAAATARSGATDYLSEPLDHRDGQDLLASLQRLDQTTYLPGDLLVKADIATMAASLEGRSPFLDYRLIEWAASVPADLKLRGGRSKYVLRQAMRERLPAETLNSPKRGFGVPVAAWLRGELRPLLESTLLAPRSLNRGYLRPEAIQQLVAEHLSGRINQAKPLWTLLMLELWHQELVDQSPTPTAPTTALA